MALIQISNLTTASSDLLAGTESFLTELQDTDTTQIIGGGGHGGHGGDRDDDDHKKKKEKEHDGGCNPCYPCH
jgi:hypothetical protein